MQTQHKLEQLSEAGQDTSAVGLTPPRKSEPVEMRHKPGFRLRLLHVQGNRQSGRSHR